MVVNILAIHNAVDAVYVLVALELVKGVLIVVNGAVQADAKDATGVKADAGRNALEAVLEAAKDAQAHAHFLVLVFVKENAVSLVVAVVHLDALVLVNQIALDVMDVQIVALLVVPVVMDVQIVVLVTVIQHVEMDVRLLAQTVALVVLADVLVAVLDVALLVQLIVLANAQILATQLVLRHVSTLVLEHVTEL